MLIDDERNILKLYSALLIKNGYKVFDFISARDAISFLQKEEVKIDLIISDLNMPSMTGLQFLDHLKKTTKYSSIPLIFLSAISDSKTHVDAFDSGAVDFLTKPVQNEIFLSKIRALLKSYVLKSTQERIFLEGTRQDKEIDDIIAVCEVEGITGFVVFYHAGQRAVIHFKGGLLEEVALDRLTGAEALEALGAWETYSFSIFQGRFDEDIVTQFLPNEIKNENSASADRSYTKAETVLEEGMLEMVLLPATDADIADNPGEALKFKSLYQLNHQFIQSISQLIHQPFEEAELEFTDKKVFTVIRSEDKNTAIVFKDKNVLRSYREKNGLQQ